jgi:phosphate transport system permease protein
MSNKMNIPNQKNTAPPLRTLDIVNKGLKRRYRAEKRFRFYGMLSILASLGFLSFLFISIINDGHSAFQQTYIELTVHIDPAVFEESAIATADYNGLIKKALRSRFPDVSGRGEKRNLYRIVSTGAAFQLRERVLENQDIIGEEITLWVPADDNVDMLMKGNISREVAENRPPGGRFSTGRIPDGPPQPAPVRPGEGTGKVCRSSSDD